LIKEVWHQANAYYRNEIMSKSGDQAFRVNSNSEIWPEMTYGGALSFLRRRYSRALENVDVVVSGIPYDASVTNRPGCRFGPRAIREASTQLSELSSFPFGFDLFEHLNVIDWGDCMIDPHHPGNVLDTILLHARHIINSNCRMLTFGGDHLVSYPLIKAHAEKYGPVALLQFDAHCDTWSDDGTRMDHGTMFARATSEGIINVEKSVQIGLRTQNDSDMGFEILTAPWVHRNGVSAAIDVILNRVKGCPLYISFDIDGLDPAFAPGTGTPVVGGLATWQALEILRSLSDLNLVGMDVVEVSPPYDHSEISALAAATVSHDWLCLLAKKAGAVSNIVGRL
jgi:agmatinase